MRLGPLAILLLSFACGAPPGLGEPVRDRAAPPPGPVRVVEFEGWVSPSRGELSIAPVSSGSAGLFGEVPVARDGAPGSGPPGTVELVTLSTGPCAGLGTFGGRVQLNSYVDRRISNVIVQITSVTPPILVQPRPGTFDVHPSLDSSQGLWVYGAPGEIRWWCFDLIGGVDFRFRGRVLAEVPEESAVGPATCAELETDASVWGLYSQGLDLRVRTQSRLHWIGCASTGCFPITDFFCESGPGFLHFGTRALDRPLRALVDPGNARGDHYPAFTHEPGLGIANAPDRNAPPSGVDPVAALCRVLGYSADEVVSGTTANYAPEAEALDPNGLDWTLDGETSDEAWGAQFCCHDGGGCP